MKHALSGPNSDIHCILEPNDQIEGTKDIWITKDFPKCQIPGLNYRLRAISNIPKPSGWCDSIISERDLKMNNLKEKRGESYLYFQTRSDKELKEKKSNK